MTESFPRQEARTRRFTLGVPRAFRVSPDGSRVAYLRTKGGADPVTCLWVLDVATGQERLVADPRSSARTARRRGGPAAGGTGPAGTGQGAGGRHRGLRDRPGRHGGRLRAVRPRATRCGLTGGGGAAGRARGGHAHARAGSPPRPGRAAAGLRLRGRAAGRRLAGGAGRDRVLADPRGAPGVTFGLPEFIAAEEMGRHARLLVGPGRLGPAGRPGGRDARAPVAHRRSRAPRAPARRGRLPRGRHPERRRVPAPGPARRPQPWRSRPTGPPSRTW